MVQDAATTPPYAYNLVIGAVGAVALMLLGTLIRSINRMSESFKQRMDNLSITLNELYIVVCGNPKVDGDHGLAGKINGHSETLAEHGRDIQELQRRAAGKSRL